MTDLGRSEPDTAETITKEDARLRWGAAMQRNGWEGSVLRTIMFDSDRPTDYCAQPPAWNQVALRGDPMRADRRRYEALEERLIAQGRTRSTGTPKVDLAPDPVDETLIAATIEAVSSMVDPACVTQEQILRAAFIAHLPPHLAQAIGTPRGAVHLERQTPSDDYQQTGHRKMVARYDLGFGHPERSSGIHGVAELKVVGSLDEQLSSGLEEDFAKLLDRKLPPTAFRISWLVGQRRANGDANQLARARSGQLLGKLASQLDVATPRSASMHPTRRWLTWVWEPDVTIQLAWYQPTGTGPATP